MILEKKIDQFYKYTLESATNQKIALLEEFEQSLEKNLQDHKKGALRKAELSYKVEEASLMNKKNKALANASIQTKRVLNEKSDEITNTIFVDVQRKLVEYMKTPAYTSLLISQIKKAKEYAANESITIHINSTDAPLKKELEAATNSTLTISETDFLGGSRAIIPSRNILIDHSFTTRIKDAKEAFQL